VFEDWISTLCVSSVEELDRPGLCDAAASVSRLKAAADAYEARVLAAVDRLDDRGAPASTVARSASRCSQREADRKARRAQTLTVLPSAADGLASGALSAEHVDLLGRAVEATSADAVEASGLVDRVTRRPADMAARDARDWVRSQQDATDVEATHRRRVAARRLSIFDNDDGMTVVHGVFDPVTGEQIRKAVAAETNRLFHADGGRAKGSDVRTPEQRRADAVAAMLTGASRPGGCPPVRNQVLLTATVADGAIVDGRLPDGRPLPDAIVERLACGSDLYALLLSQAGDPLWMGRRVRLATDAQWRSLIARDGGCVICSADPSRCEAHHVVAWQPPGAGPTDITNLVLLCGHHHHLVHDLGWRIVRATDGWELQPP
jgi:hypothetical protein